MPRRETFELRPVGWENDPQEEIFELSTLDYLSSRVYLAFATFFRIENDADKPKVAEVLKQGLEKTLSQTRHVCAVIERRPGGDDDDAGYAFVKRRDSTVQFIVQYLDGPDDVGKYPSFSQMEEAAFLSKVLGNLDTWSVEPMTYGEKPEAMLESHPKAAAFKASFVPGGLVFMIHFHHVVNDIMGTAGFIHQLAENCTAIWKKDASLFPPWNPACMDVSLFTREVPKEKQIDGPLAKQKHPGHKKASWLMFHLPKSKAAELKKLASPKDGSYWISTYDAFEAFMWRTLSRHRVKLYKPDACSTPVWGEAVNMRKRCHNPPVPARMQHNLIDVALSNETRAGEEAPPQLTVAEITGSSVGDPDVVHGHGPPPCPLSKLAWFVRQMTNRVTQERLGQMIDEVAPVRDKSTLFLRCDSFAPMYNFTTDWRDTNIAAADFGFAKPAAFRLVTNFVTPGLTFVYPPRTDDPASDEGPEFYIGFENEIREDLLRDPEWCKYFEFRGVDGEEA